MNKKKLCLLLVLSVTFAIAQRAIPDTIQSKEGPIIIQPITHGTLVLKWKENTIYVDPYGGAEAFNNIDAPSLILITDIHGDHTDLETLKGLNTQNANFIVPPAVADILNKDYEKQITVIKNGGMSVHGDIFINALPMYNLPEVADSKHPRGRGNGYFINLGGKTIYISGDTEDIKEMRDLRRIDVAFISMNLPYTMDIHQAANAVLDFKPKIVYPYHYRGNPNISDTEAFKKLVNSKNKKIEVRLKNWYPNN